MHKKHIDIFVEERGARAVAIVFLVPVEHRELAEKLVAKLKEEM